MLPNGAFTPPENETKTDTENNYTEPSGNLCCQLSLCTVNTSIQSYATILCLEIGLSVGQCKHTIVSTKHIKHTFSSPKSHKILRSRSLTLFVNHKCHFKSHINYFTSDIMNKSRDVSFKSIPISTLSKNSFAKNVSYWYKQFRKLQTFFQLWQNRLPTTPKNINFMIASKNTRKSSCVNARGIPTTAYQGTSSAVPSQGEGVPHPWRGYPRYPPSDLAGVPCIWTWQGYPPFGPGWGTPPLPVPGVDRLKT